MRTGLNADHAAAGSLGAKMEKEAYFENAVVALVGTPNSGKTTLFNWLTGSRFKTVNYPGATVDYSIGRVQSRYSQSDDSESSAHFFVMDTPGTYSLDPKSPDERVTQEAVFSHRQFGSASVVVAVADATHLSRQLLLTKQLIEVGFPVVLALTMEDLVSEQREMIDVGLLSNHLGIPVVLIDGRLGGGVADLVSAVRRELDKKFSSLSSDSIQKLKEGSNVRVDLPLPNAWSAEKIEESLRTSEALVASVVKPLPAALGKSSKVEKFSTAAERTKKLDRVLLHPIWGLVIFVVLMTGLFSSIFWAATPLMDLIDETLSGLADTVLNLAPSNLLIQFLANGVIASVSAVLVFVPQIFILFLGIVFLEDSGYLARSATLMDKPLSLLGLGGRSFVPLLSGYACAVPAMMAARTISSKKERWLTLFVVPLMSCSARLPVYALLLAFLFAGEAAWKPGIMLAGIYLGSMVVGALAAVMVSKFVKFEDRSFFMLELPVYRRPKLRMILRQALTRTNGYVRRAGPPIFLFALLVWIGTTFPNYRAEDATEKLNTSYAAQLGKVIEPVFEPMGGDWRTGVGLISAFAAREVFVSSLAVVFQIADDDEGTMQETLINKMQEARAPSGYPLFTVSTVLGLIVFFMIALQCLSTVMVAAREAGGWKFAIGQLVIFNLVGYGLAVAIVQGLRSIGIA